MKRKIIMALIAAATVLILLIVSINLDTIVSRLNVSQKAAPVKKAEPVKQEIPAEAEPQIVSTKPEPLEDTIISATEIVEITFNRPLENRGEFKSRIEPKIDYKIELSSDRKTAKIMPAKPYQLGTTYTLFIGPDSKFDGAGSWGKEKIYHFRTIRYTGV